jgi:hypothetical protein
MLKGTKDCFIFGIYLAESSNILAPASTFPSTSKHNQSAHIVSYGSFDLQLGVFEIHLPNLHLHLPQKLSQNIYRALSRLRPNI